MSQTKSPPKKNRHAAAIDKAFLPFEKPDAEPTPEALPRPAFSTTSRPMNEVRQVLITEITPDKTQPRRVQPDSDGMADLIQSIREQGVFNPIILRAVDDGYVIIAGERRFTAAREIGLERVPARVMDVTPESARLIQLAENLQREDLNPIEEAHGLQQLLDETGWKATELATRIGKSKTYVSRMIAITTKFPPAIQGELERVAHAQLPRKSRIFEALAASDEKTQREILFGGLPRDASRAAMKKTTSKGGRPRNYSKKFNVPGATVTVTLKTSEGDGEAVADALKAASDEADQLST